MSRTSTCTDFDEPGEVGLSATGRMIKPRAPAMARISPQQASPPQGGLILGAIARLKPTLPLTWGGELYNLLTYPVLLI